MDAKDLLTLAWEAVKAADLPEHLHEVAFREAVAHLRAQTNGSGAAARWGAGQRQHEDAPAPPSPGGGGDFYSRLAHESGVAEDDIRQVLHLEDDGETVRVIQPARQLGRNNAEQVRRVVALVASARHFGLGESPISAQAVRDECTRKKCMDSNFAKRVETMRGLNLADRTRLMANSRWVDEFQEAVNHVLGRDDGS